MAPSSVPRAKPLNKQGQEEIEKLKAEKNDLQQKLVAEHRATKSTSRALSQKAEVQRLHEQQQVYLKKIEIERSKIEKIDQCIEKAHRKILEQRKAVGANDTSSKDNAHMIEKQIRILENRLNQSLVKFNERVAQNKELRKRIDDMRQERVVFDGIYKKLERELAEKAQEMAEIIEEGRKACKARDKARGELMTLKRQAEESREAFEKEWKELGRLIEEEKKAQEAKREERLALVASSRRPPTRGASGAKPPASEQRSDGVESQDGPEESSGTDELTLAEKQERDYDEALKQIKDATGITDVDTMITKFLEAEEKNFSRFNYVMELNGEIESLEQQVAAAKLELEEAKGRGANIDTRRKMELKKMLEKKAKTEAKVQESEQRYKSAAATLEQLKAGIASMYERIGCSQINELLGSQGVTDSNVLEHLAVIEQRAAEIMEQNAASRESKDGERSCSLLSPAPMPASKKKDLGAQLHVEPPAAMDFSSGDESGQDDDERPLTRDELHQKTWRALNSK